MNHPPTAELILGVLAGLAAAFGSAVSYLVSRLHGLRQQALGRRGSMLRLLAPAHVLMGVACLPLVAWLWPQSTPDTASVAVHLIALVGSYLLGQGALFAALERAEASRVAPLLGLKIAMLAVLVTGGLGQPLDAHQWLAASLSIAAVFVMQRGSGAVPMSALGLALASCLCFALSDLWIVRLIDALQSAGGRLGRLQAGGLAMALTYVSCGTLFLPVLAGLGPLSRSDWIAAGHYAAAWLGAMVGLYSCFGLVGVVFGNILQSTRGVVAVVLGAVLAHLGWHELEQRIDRSAFLRRMAAALLMTAAIALYVADLS